MTTSLRAGRWLLSIALVAASACASSELDLHARAVRDTVKSARASGAYRCAPRELAIAEARMDFAERSLESGDGSSARDHLRVADTHAQQALRMSPADRCQSEDRDRDKVADRLDRCPADPEDRDGFEDEDGCPDLDNDRDGVADARDRCPTEPEDADRFKDDDGCPERDNDEDGLADLQDRCPQESEDKDGFEDADGCPEPDNDRDAYLDPADKCPDHPGPPGGDGCPPKFRFIEVTADKIELRQTIYFQTARAVIMTRSYPLLEEVALALKARPGIRVRIEGHTDGRGNRSTNTALSQARADAVRSYLVGRGVGGDRLDARGFGPDQPIETNKTAAGREKNRRVEFVITQS